MPAGDSRSRPSARASAALDVTVCDARGLPRPAPGLAAWLARVAPPGARGEVTIAFVSDARMRAMNREWRGADYATDVLSFPAENGAAEAGHYDRNESDADGALRTWSRDDRKEPHADAAPRTRSREPRASSPGPRAVSREPRAVSREPGAESREPRARSPEPASLGEIVIATGVAARQARQAAHPVATEWRVLALHGLLHLLGYDHERDGGTMARVERRLRRKGGLHAGLIERAPNPGRAPMKKRARA